MNKRKLRSTLILKQPCKKNPERRYYRREQELDCYKKKRGALLYACFLLGCLVSFTYRCYYIKILTISINSLISFLDWNRMIPIRHHSKLSFSEKQLYRLIYRLLKSYLLDRLRRIHCDRENSELSEKTTAVDELAEIFHFASSAVRSNISTFPHTRTNKALLLLS